MHRVPVLPGSASRVLLNKGAGAIKNIAATVFALIELKLCKDVMYDDSLTKYLRKVLYEYHNATIPKS